jgi:histidinol-phosphate aminotransferase
MSTPLDLLREDLRDFAGYASARSHAVPGRVWLNANESPWPNPADATRDAHRYPAPQPAPLLQRLATLYGVPVERLLLGRGSDEAIDLLVRAFCRPGRDPVVVAPPVFGMYAVSARLQGAPLCEVPLRDGDGGFVADLDALAAAVEQGGAKLLFLCSPANPTGQALAADAVLALAWRLQGRCIVVVDEAYAEYSDEPSLAARAGRPDNLAVLRTLSKAHALAAARIGALIAAPELVAALRRLQAPYPLPSPCVQLALEGLAPAALAQTRARVQVVRGERARLLRQLPALPGVRTVYASQGNFVLVRFADADAAYARLLAAGVVVRDQRALPQLGDALRISVGTPAENDALLAALRNGRAVA